MLSTIKAYFGGDQSADPTELADLRRRLADALAVIDAQDDAMLDATAAVHSLHAQLLASRAEHAACLAALNEAREERRRVPWAVGQLVMEN